MLKNSEFYETLVDGIGEGINKPKADFDENDPKNSGYIKNRTHWKEEIPEKNVVICEGIQPSGSDNTYARDKWPLAEHLVAGVTYRMTVNGYAYSAVATTAPAGIALSLKKDSDNAIGAVYESNQSGKLSFSGSPSGAKEFKIELNEPAHTVYHPIDANYLPQNRTTYTVVISENPDTGELELSKETPWEDLVKAYEDECNLVLLDSDYLQYSQLEYVEHGPEFPGSLFCFVQVYSDSDGDHRYAEIMETCIIKPLGGEVFINIEFVDDLITRSELSCRVDVIDTSGGNYRCDLDFDTIYDWCNAGKNVYCYCHGQGYGILPLNSYSDSNIIFEGDAAYMGTTARRTVEIKSDGAINVSKMGFGYLPGISDTANSITEGQTIVAKHVQSGANMVDQWEAADIVSPGTIGNLSDLATTSKENLVAAINEVKASGGSGGTSVQADWNQNDESAADYVKNRTHWAEFGQVRRYLAKDTTIKFESGGSWKIDDAFQYSYPSDISLEAGQQVNFRIGSGMYSATLTSDTVTNLRAAISDINPTAFIFDTANHTVSAYGANGGPYGFDIFVETEGITGYHPLDENYLPDSVKSAVLYTEQSLTEEQQAQARENIGGVQPAITLIYSWNGNGFNWNYTAAEIRNLRTKRCLFQVDSCPANCAYYAGNMRVSWFDGDVLRYTDVDDNGKSGVFYVSNIGGITGQVTADKVTNPDNTTDLVQYGAFQAAVPLVQQLGISDAQAGQLAKIKTVNDSGNPTSWEAVDMPSGSDLSLGLTSASVGQIIKVKAVDEDGKPTEWETAEMDEDFELINEVTAAEDSYALTISVDKDGNPFELKEAAVLSWTVPFAESTNNLGRAQGFTDEARWGWHIFPMASSIPAGQSGVIGRYDLTHVKVVNGYIMQMGRWESQNTGNVRSVLMKTNSAGNAPFNLNITDDQGTPTLANPQGNITCYKIVSHGNPSVSAGSIVRLYGKRA